MKIMLNLEAKELGGSSVYDLANCISASVKEGTELWTPFQVLFRKDLAYLVLFQTNRPNWGTGKGKGLSFMHN